MTTQEFLSLMQSRGAILYPAATERDIILASSALQSRRCAIMPPILTELYKHSAGINLGGGYIFGPTEIARTNKYPIPSIVQINEELTSIPAARGKTIFGRNDLFWFAFDAFGVFYMLDNLTLRVLRKYDDPLRAMTDCLIAGKY